MSIIPQNEADTNGRLITKKKVLFSKRKLSNKAIKKNQYSDVINNNANPRKLFTLYIAYIIINTLTYLYQIYFKLRSSLLTYSTVKILYIGDWALHHTSLNNSVIHQLHNIHV